MPASAIAWKICAATPGRSGAPWTVILLSFLLRVTPETSTCSIEESSLVTIVPGLSVKLEQTRTGTL